MFTDNFLQHDMHELELEMQRRCVALNLDSTNEYELHVFARDVLQNMDKLKESAAQGEILARTKMELYSLAMLMHKSLLELYGPDYINRYADLSVQNVAWAALVKAFWRELEHRNIGNLSEKQDDDG